MTVSNSEILDCDLPSVSVVVPVYQGAENIADCIQSLLDQNYPRQILEIIVVDNNSTDGTAEIVQAMPVLYLKEKTPGACSARNTGYRTAANELIAFTDSDCIADRDWLRKIAPIFADINIGGCGGKLEAAPAQNAVEEYVIYKDILSQERALESFDISPPFLVTANVVYRKRVLDEIRGFDEDFNRRAGEDADLAWRVHAAGYNLAFEPEAIVAHRHRSTLWSLLRQIGFYGAGSSYLFKKHRGRFGFNGYFAPAPYKEMVSSFFKIPKALLMGKTKLERRIPLFDFLGSIAFLTGKLSASLRLGIKFY